VAQKKRFDSRRCAYHKNRGNCLVETKEHNSLKVKLMQIPKQQNIIKTPTAKEQHVLPNIQRDNRKNYHHMS
jgi:hypothetical protein